MVRTGGMPFAWEGEVPEGATVTSAPEFPWEGVAELGAEVFEDGPVEVGTLDPNAVGSHALDEIAQEMTAHLGRGLQFAEGGECFVRPVKGEGLGTGCATGSHLREEVGMNGEFVDDRESLGDARVKHGFETVAVEGKKPDFSDDGGGLAGEGFDVDDDGGGGRGGHGEEVSR